MATTVVVTAEAIMSLEEHQKETRLLRKRQSNSSNTMLEILNECIVFLK